MEQGDRVRKRGSDNEGRVEKTRSHPQSKGGRWVWVRWDKGVEARTRPLICSDKELEKI